MTTPEHVAIIMDGNGRWGLEHKNSRIKGHEAGARAVETTIDHAISRGIKVLTLFAFGKDNWRRPKLEIDALFRLLKSTFQTRVNELAEKNIRLRWIGDEAGLPSSVVNALRSAEELTANNTGLTVVVAINYSGRWDLDNAVATMLKNGHTDFKPYLALADIGSPDLFIRTSGEQRLSDFLLYDLAYSELVFEQAYWPDFSPKHFDAALASFANRERRFGAAHA